MRKAGWAVIAVAAGVACFTLTPIEEARSSCAYCKLGRTELRALGVVVRSTFRDNECSLWYPAHVERTHEHLWAPAAHSALINLFGMTRLQPYRGFRAIRMISPETQIRVYSKFEDPRDAKELFGSLGRGYKDTAEGEYQYTLASLRAQVIREWERDDFPGTWDERWDRYCAENQEFVSWLESRRHALDGLNRESFP